MIAMALICGPRLLIADEPTTALDVTVQAKILDLLHDLQERKKMSMVLITHNLGIVGDIADHVMVMYAGEVMEYTAVHELFEEPLHPYTVNLLATIPGVDARKKRLTVIPGEVPTLRNIPAGCPFHPRCDRCFDRCRSEHPPLTTPAPGHQVRCFLYD
jgi:peptide/nickel transport system ATP-binding protein